METGLLDKHGKEISVGDFVSLAGNMTTDDSMGDLPNGWIFDETDVYEVYFDERIGKYSLKLGVEPDTRVNAKYMNHAVALLHDGNVEIVPHSVDIKERYEDRERCHAAMSDGECIAPTCPQLRDGEPAKTGRHCPLDTWVDDEL